MRILLTSLMALTLALAFGGVAAAQDRPIAPDQEFTFGDDIVEGGSVGPSGEIIDTQRRFRRTSLVRPRVHFFPELVMSVEGV